jgi:hypothetical protein
MMPRMDRPHTISILLSLAAIAVALASLHQSHRSVLINEWSSRPAIEVTSLRLTHDWLAGEARASFVITVSNLGKTKAGNASIALYIFPKPLADFSPSSEFVLRGPILSGAFAPGLIRTVPFEAAFEKHSREDLLTLTPEDVLVVFGRNSYYGDDTPQILEDWCLFKAAEFGDSRLTIRQGEFSPCPLNIINSREGDLARTQLSLSQ